MAALPVGRHGAARLPAQGSCQRRELTGPSSAFAAPPSRRPGLCGQAVSESPVAGARQIRRAGDAVGILFLPSVSSRAWAARHAWASAIPAFIAAVGMRGLAFAVPDPLPRRSGQAIPLAPSGGRSRWPPQCPARHGAEADGVKLKTPWAL